MEVLEKRFYDPQSKRWLTPDPLGFFESSNAYLYTLNSPLNRLDLFGLFSENSGGWYFAPSDVKSSSYFASNYIKPLEPLMCRGPSSIGPCANSVDIVVTSGLFHQMHFSPQEIFENRANLIDHLHEIVPTQKGIIGLITIENGIGTSLKELVSHCISTMDDIPERPTCIGFHNKSEGMRNDVHRTIIDELLNRTMTTNAIKTGEFIGLIADSLNRIQSQSFWLHIPHSEAGVLFNLGHTMLTPTQKSLLQNQLIVFAVAPAEPISWRHCFESSNTYSDKDAVTGGFGKSYINNSDYHIQFTKCQSPKKERILLLGDHYYDATTYREARREEIKDLRRKYGFYDSRKR